MKLYPYQEDGVEFIMQRWEQGVPAYLADIMGLGKTAQAAVAARRMGMVNNMLIITTASSIPNWRRELRMWGVTCPIATVSFNAVAAAPYRYRAGWDLVIIDEAHYCKTPTAQRTRAALAVAQDAKHALLISGSPMPNHAGELYAPIDAMWPGVTRQLGVEHYNDWVNMFCNWTNTIYGPKVYSSKDGDKLRPYLNRFMLRRKLADVDLQLPPLRVDVQLLPNDSRIADALEDMGLEPDTIISHMGLESSDPDGSLSRLRRLLGTYKTPLVLKIISAELKAREYQKIVIMAYHHDTLALVRQGLSEFGVVGFDGSTPIHKRQQAVDEFTNGTARVFAAQQTAAGEAINLQVAHEIVQLEPAWSPEVNAQIIKRVHRIGSVHAVRARVFAVAGTLDEGIMEVNARKTRMQLALGL